MNDLTVSVAMGVNGSAAVFHTDDDAGIFHNLIVESSLVEAKSDESNGLNYKSNAYRYFQKSSSFWHEGHTGQSTFRSPIGPRCPDNFKTGGFRPTSAKAMTPIIPPEERWIN